MRAEPHRYFILNKPYGMESQFVSPYDHALLGNLDFSFPEGTHAVGRLDKNSEGLLLLTTNKRITHLLFQSSVPHRRTYLVQVKNELNPENLARLRTGVSIRIRGGSHYLTPPCPVDIVTKPGNLFPAPYTIHESMASTWLHITLTQGKFHQVRKMMAAVHHRCMRLIRISIEDMHLNNLQPGQVKEVDEHFFFTHLKLGEVPVPAV